MSLNNNSDKIKNEVFSKIQNILKEVPVIIWGSGATIPYGMPSMSDLTKAIGEKFPDFNSKTINLEEELGKPEYTKIFSDIKQIIWNVINSADSKFLNGIINGEKVLNIQGISSMIEYFIKPTPHLLNIITTNYDRVLENILSFRDINFTDGFNGRNLSSFSIDHFKERNIVNIIKVHGALNWFNVQGEPRYCITNNNGSFDPIIIPPGNKKYEAAYQDPYRDLIHKSDDVIKQSKSIFVVGFGFNDTHLAPKIKNQVKKYPIVLITKEMTESAQKELQDAEEYVFLEQHKNGTRVRLKHKEKKETEYYLEDDYWTLKKFMEILI